MDVDQDLIMVKKKLRHRPTPLAIVTIWLLLRKNVMIDDDDDTAKVSLFVYRVTTS